jgi:hypothetical protein
MAGRDVELGAAGDLGQRRLAAGVRDRLEQRDRTVDRLDAVTFAGGTRRARD